MESRRLKCNPPGSSRRIKLYIIITRYILLIHPNLRISSLLDHKFRLIYYSSLKCAALHENTTNYCIALKIFIRRNKDTARRKRSIYFLTESPSRANELIKIKEIYPTIKIFRTNSARVKPSRTSWKLPRDSGFYKA